MLKNISTRKSKQKSMLLILAALFSSVFFTPSIFAISGSSAQDDSHRLTTSTTHIVDANNGAQSVRRNLALNRAAYQSSCINYDNTAHLVTDGSKINNSFFSSKWISQSSDPQWIYIDLGAVCDIDRVKLYWDITYAKDYRIEVSNDRIEWKSVYVTASGDGEQDDISIAPTKARYVRMNGTKRSSNSGYSLIEFEVYGTGGIAVTSTENPNQLPDGTQYLSGGNWKLLRADYTQENGSRISQANFDDKTWIKATVPGTILTSYLNNGSIPDPNFGDQQLQISDAFFTSDFWYRNSFVIPANYPGKKIWLNFDGINWKADVYVNGKNLGAISGAFIRGKFEITSLVTPGEMAYLAVNIHKNANSDQVTLQNLVAAGPNGGLLGADNPTIHSSIGWDWMPTIRGRNTGIQDNVYLSCTKDVLIADPFVITDLHLPSMQSADLTLKVDLKNSSVDPAKGVLKGTINPGNITFSQVVNLNGSEIKTITIDKNTFSKMTIHNPKLWWPNGYGDQNMYNLTLSFEIDGAVSDTKSIPFGIRDITPDYKNNVLSIDVNGKRIFLRGGNWGMSESMLRLDKEGYDLRVRLHKEENFTMIRNWVGMTGDENFYNACDKYGILVWDDFWLANPNDGPDPNDPTMFMNNAIDKIKRFRNHPSIALYCGRNEGNPPATLAMKLVNAITAFDGTRPYIPNSAAGLVSGLGPYGLQNPKWYFQNRSIQRLHSEMGMPNVPSVESMQAMMPADKLWPINDMWGIHDFCNSAQEASTYVSAINNSYGKASDIYDFCLKAQMVNMENHKAMFEPFAGAKGNGLLMWMSQSAWPSTVWQTYDYYLEQTAGFYGCKKACEPLHILWDCNSDIVKVSNNTGQEFNNLRAEAQIYNMDGTLKYTHSVMIGSPADHVTDCFSLTFPADLSPTHFIRLRLMKGKKILSDNFYWRGITYQDYSALADMNKVNLKGTFSKSVSGSTHTITVKISNPGPDVALMIHLKMLKNLSNERVLPTFYSDNYFSLLPGESKQVTLEYDSKYIGNESPKLVVEGWNINAFELTD